jgi:chemotaxis protein MotB
MAGSSERRRGRGGNLDVWPGYVDALSTLLMVIIFYSVPVLCRLMWR